MLHLAPHSPRHTFIAAIATHLLRFVPDDLVVHILHFAGLLRRKTLGHPLQLPVAANFASMIHHALSQFTMVRTQRVDRYGAHFTRFRIVKRKWRKVDRIAFVKAVHDDGSTTSSYGRFIDFVE